MFGDGALDVCIIVVEAFVEGAVKAGLDGDVSPDLGFDVCF